MKHTPMAGQLTIGTHTHTIEGTVLYGPWRVCIDFFTAARDYSTWVVGMDNGIFCSAYFL